jgi:hypothetical protein
VVALPGKAMPSTAGAYGISTGTIYLTQEWLQSAIRERVLAVLSEELGHHLDGMLNASGTPGDEGELFAALLGGASLSEQQHWSIVAQSDHASIEVNGLPVAVEQAAQVVSTPIRPASPGRTSGEWRNQYAFAALKADGLRRHLGKHIVWRQQQWRGQPAGLRRHPHRFHPRSVRGSQE